MSLLNVSELGFAYPSTGVLFSGASFSIDPGDRLAIVGGNGTGKSTLLRLLAGELPPSQGEIARRAGMRIAHVLQEQAAEKEQPLFDFVLGDLARIRRQMIEYECGVDSIAAAEYAAIVNDYGAAGGYALEAETERILDGLGFTVGESILPLASLSGGQRTRAALARALNYGAELLLLDEPTNHLDIAAREWLESELNARPARACALVSHDRTLLRRVANRVLEIHRGRITLFEYGYEEYRAASLLRDRQAWQNYEAYERRKAAAEEAALKRARLAVKVAATPDGARSSHDFYRRKAGKVARTGRLLRERVNHEVRVDKPWEEAPIPALDFGMVRRSGGIALSVHGLAKSFANKTLFTGLDFHLARGERLAILGPNGSGKTTLLRMLLGEESADAGEVRTGVNVTIGYLAQETEDLDGAATPLQICGGSTLPRTLLGCLKLRPDRVNQPVAELSPGERAKVALVRLLVGGANLLLLDEPTNHLEIEAQQALEQALAQYPGSVVIVSHDRSFLAGLGERLKRIEL